MIIHGSAYEGAPRQPPPVLPVAFKGWSMLEDAPLHTDASVSGGSLRFANIQDLVAIQALSTRAVNEKRALPLRNSSLLAALRSALVLVREERVVGFVTWRVASETRAELEMLEAWDPADLGVLLEGALVGMRNFGMSACFVVTDRPEPLLVAGFVPVARQSIPEKVEAGCLRCVAAGRCRKQGFVRDL
jgi:amino-acid N-acetyltransferase